jgi:hypothetical protein
MRTDVPCTCNLRKHGFKDTKQLVKKLLRSSVLMQLSFPSEKLLLVQGPVLRSLTTWQPLMRILSHPPTRRWCTVCLPPTLAMSSTTVAGMPVAHAMRTLVPSGASLSSLPLCMHWPPLPLYQLLLFAPWFMTLLSYQQTFCILVFYWAAILRCNRRPRWLVARRFE